MKVGHCRDICDTMHINSLAPSAHSNQIRVAAFQLVQLAQASFLQKKSNIAKCFFDICNAEMAQSLSSLQKSEFLKFIISFFHHFWCQNWDHWHKMGGKNTHIYFFYFWFKNKQVWAEKNPQKISKNLKVAGNYPNPLLISTDFLKYPFRHLFQTGIKIQL